MTHQEICLIRVLLSFALLLAGLFPLCVVIFGLPTTLWVWGLGYVSCFVGTFWLLRQGHSDTPASRARAGPELAALAPLLRKHLSLACPQMPPGDVTYIVWSVLKEVFPVSDNAEVTVQLHQRDHDCQSYSQYAKDMRNGR